MKDSFYLTRQILRLRLERQPDSGEEEALVHSCLSDGGLYVVADPATSEAEWAGKSFGIAVQDKTLRLFIEKIVVHEKDVKWSKHASQTVEIHYTDIGVVGNMNITKSA